MVNMMEKDEQIGNFTLPAMKRDREETAGSSCPAIHRFQILPAEKGEEVPIGLVSMNSTVAPDTSPHDTTLTSPWT